MRTSTHIPTASRALWCVLLLSLLQGCDPDSRARTTTSSAREFERELALLRPGDRRAFARVLLRQDLPASDTCVLVVNDTDRPACFRFELEFVLDGRASSFSAAVDHLPPGSTLALGTLSMRDQPLAWTRVRILDVEKSYRCIEEIVGRPSGTDDTVRPPLHDLAKQ